MGATTAADIALDSLQRRIAGMHSLWREALDTMTAEQVNHCERPGVLPIAFSVNHQPRLEDSSLMLLGADAPLWNTQGWAARVKPTLDDIGKETTVEQMEQFQIGDYDAMVEYAHAVYDRTEAWIGALDAERLTEVQFGGGFPPFIEHAFIARVVRDRTVTLLDALECWIYQHGIRHMGELEHARALVGLGGLTS